MILQVRQLHESLTHRSITSRFKPIVALEDGDVFGYEAVREMPSRNRQTESMVQTTDCRLTDRINQQHRLVAAEQASRLEEDTRLFFALQASEVSADFLPETLRAFAGRGGLSSQNGRADSRNGRLRYPLLPTLRLAIERTKHRESFTKGFCGGAAQIADWSNVAPDYLKLAPVAGERNQSCQWRMAHSADTDPDDA